MPKNCAGQGQKYACLLNIGTHDTSFGWAAQRSWLVFFAPIPTAPFNGCPFRLGPGDFGTQPHWHDGKTPGALILLSDLTGVKQEQYVPVRVVPPSEAK